VFGLSLLGFCRNNGDHFFQVNIHNTLRPFTYHILICIWSLRNAGKRNYSHFLWHQLWTRWVHFLPSPAGGDEPRTTLSFSLAVEEEPAVSQHQHQQKASLSLSLSLSLLLLLLLLRSSSSSPSTAEHRPASASRFPASPWTTRARRRRPCSSWPRPTRRSRRPDPSSGGCSGKGWLSFPLSVYLLSLFPPLLYLCVWGEKGEEGGGRCCMHARGLSKPV